jgi:O-antigen ligase
MKLDYKKYFINVSSFILYLFPASLILSTFLSNLFVTIISLSFLFYIILRKTELPGNIFFKLFIIFWLYLILRSLFAENIFFSVRSSFFYIRYIFFSFAIIFIIENNKYFLKNFLKIFLVTLSILLFDGLIQFLFGTNITGINAKNLEDGRISGLFGKELVLGSFISKIIFLLLAILCLTKINYQKSIFLGTFFFSVMVVLISGDRSPFFIIILLSLILLILLKFFKVKTKIIFSLFLVSSILFTIYSSQSIRERVIRHTASQLINNFSSEAKIHKLNIFSKGHEAHYLAAYKMFKENVIFGQGPNMFRLLCKKNEFYVEPQSCSTHPHNYYIQLLAETGLIGFSFLMALFLFIAGHLLFKKLSNFGILISLSLMLNLFPLIPTGNFFNSWIANLYFLSFAFYVYGIKTKLLFK